MPVDPGLPGVTIFLDDNGNNQRDEGERFTTTDANGNYTFSGLLPGTYTVAEELQPGWEQTAPAGFTHEVVVASSQAVTEIKRSLLKEMPAIASLLSLTRTVPPFATAITLLEIWLK